MNEQQNTNNTYWYQSKLFKQIMFALVDTVSVLGAYLFMLSFRFGGKIPPLYYESFTGSLVFIILIHLVVNLAFHLYSSLWKHAGLTEILSVVGAGVFGTAFVYLYSLFFNSILPRSIYIASGFILILLLGFTRMFYRVMRHLFKGSYNSADAKRAIIIGAGETGSILSKQLQERPDLGVKVVGYIDDDAEKRNSYLNGHRVLGTVSELPKIVEKRSIDEIIFAIPSASSKVRKEILELCTKTGCKLKIIPGLDAMMEGVDIRRMRDVKPEDLLVRDEVRINNSDISEYLTDRVVLVTGGGGSIGSELCRQIAKFGPKKLIIFDIYENNAYELYISLRDEYGMDFPCEVVIGSVRDMKRVDEVFRQYQPEIVFHAAAHKHVPLMEVSPGEAVKNNVNGTFIVAKAADLVGVKRFVLISSDKAVNPTNIMGATKYLCELIMQYMNQKGKNTRYVAVRFGNVLGSNGSVIPLFRKQLERGGPITVTHKDVTRYFMTIPEAAQLVLQAGAMADEGEIFILDMGEPVKIDEFARNFVRLSGFEPDVDIKIVYTGLRPGEKMYEELWQDSDTMTESRFKGIFVGRRHPMEAEEIKTHIDYLRQHALEDPEGIHDYMEKVVPTYHSDKH